MSGVYRGNFENVQHISSARDGVNSARVQWAGSTVKLARHLAEVTEGIGFTEPVPFIEALYGYHPDDIEEMPAFAEAKKIHNMAESMRAFDPAAAPGEVVLVESVYDGPIVGELGRFEEENPSFYRFVVEPESDIPKGKRQNYTPAVVSGGLEVAVHVFNEKCSDEEAGVDDEVTPIRVAQLTTVYGERSGIRQEVQDVGAVAIGREAIIGADRREFVSYFAPLVARYLEYSDGEAMRIMLLTAD